MTVAYPGAGLEGDDAGGGNRQVTLISEESWRAADVDLGAAIGKALERRGGVYGRVVEGGVLELGSAVEIVAFEESRQEPLPLERESRGG